MIMHQNRENEGNIVRVLICSKNCPIAFINPNIWPNKKMLAVIDMGIIRIHNEIEPFIYLFEFLYSLLYEIKDGKIIWVNLPILPYFNFVSKGF